MGNVIEINTYKYCQLRDRVTNSGEHWLNDKMRAFLETRLEDDNEIWDFKKKIKNSVNKFKYYCSKTMNKMRKKNEIK